jgi:hypothetical protein
LWSPAPLIVGENTDERTWNGFLYLAFVLDCYSRLIIGWQLATHMRTELQGGFSPGQDVRAAWPSTTARWPPALFVISTRRGFAASATGILSVSTPWS